MTYVIAASRRDFAQAQRFGQVPSDARYVRHSVDLRGVRGDVIMLPGWEAARPGDEIEELLALAETAERAAEVVENDPALD